LLSANGSCILFIVSVETKFEASHQLLLHDGSKEPLHSHNWVIVADVSSTRLNSIGLVIDFDRLRSMLDDIAAGFDNTSLNENDYFHRNNPSAENVAKYVYEKLIAALPDDVKLQTVTVAEKPGCSAKYRR